MLGTLVDESALDGATLSAVTSRGREPVVEEVLRVEDLPLGSTGSRRSIVRWSDGSESVAVTFYADEVLSPVDQSVGSEGGLNAENSPS